MTGKTRSLVLGIAGSVLLAAGFFSAKACIYYKGIPDIPRPPTAVIVLQSPDEDEIFIGTEVHLSGQDSNDPDGGPLTYEWSLEIDQAGSFEDCGGFEHTCNGGTESTCCFIPQADGTFTLKLRVYNDNGFRSSEEERNLEVGNRRPVPDITVETVPNAQGHFVVGQYIWLHALLSEDPDEGDVLTYSWWPEQRPSGSVTGVFVFEPADMDRNHTSDATDAVRCLVVPDYPGSYSVGLAVSDGTLSATVYQPIEVDPDQPPCIDRTLPDASIEELLFDLDEVRRLSVVRVADDLDPYPPAGNIQFTWSIEEHPGEGLREIAGHHEPYLDMDPSEYVPGQQVRVRVTIQDREERDLSGCNINLPECNLTPGCPQWVTWNIEYR